MTSAQPPLLEAVVKKKNLREAVAALTANQADGGGTEILHMITALHLLDRPKKADLPLVESSHAVVGERRNITMQQRVVEKEWRSKRLP